MQRREFLVSTAAAAAGLAGTHLGWAQTTAAPDWRKVKPSTLDRISIMTLNFDRMLKLADAPEGPERTLELFDIAQMIADTYGVHKVEFQHYHIPSTEPSYLKDLRAHIEKSKSRMTQINVEFGNLSISAPRLRDRLMAIDLTKAWIDHAVTLGALRVMINQGQLTEESKAVAIPALKTMADYGRSRNIIVSVETRGGGGRGRGRGTAAGTAPAATTASASNAPAPAAQETPAEQPPAPPPNQPAVWKLLAELIRGANAYSNVDVGGAGAANQEELHECLRLFFPMTAGSLHTRVNPRWDLATAIKFLEHDLGYKGLYNIEASNGHDGTKEIFDVVVATL
jgi:hypothetical protein